jgi:hypothetical protein
VIHCIEKVVGYAPLSEMGDLQRREFHEALPEADAFEDVSGKWQAAILKAEQNRLDLAGVSTATGHRRVLRVSVGAGRWARRAWLRCGACAVSAQSGGAHRTGRTASCRSAWAPCSE